MRAITVRWRQAGRLAAVAVVLLAGLRVLPGVMAPPPAPPLDADVGLPRVVAGGGAAAAERAVPREPVPAPAPRPSRGVAAESAVLGTTPRRDAERPRHRKRRCRGGELLSVCERKSPKPGALAAPAPTRPPPAPPPAPVPAPAPESPPPPQPQPAPEDGSMEFAPH